MNVQDGFKMVAETGGVILKMKFRREDGTPFRAVIWIDGEEEVKELVDAIEKIEASWDTPPNERRSDIGKNIKWAKELIAEAVGRIDDGRPESAPWRLIEAAARLLKDYASNGGMDAAKHSLNKVLMPVMADTPKEASR
jgi:hypothetical protein